MIPLVKAELPDDVAEWLTDQQIRFNHLSATNSTIPKSLSDSYREARVKVVIRRETAEKCAYCESKIRHIDHGDVEHILPKSQYPQFRLTYSNLTLACKLCNQNKDDHYNTASPFLNPYVDNPSKYLIALGPMISYAPNQTRGYLTIAQLDLNRIDLLERRKERIERLVPLVERIVKTRNVAKRQVLVDALLKEMEPDKEYAFVVSGYFAHFNLL